LSPEYANKAGTSLALWRGALDPALAISVILYMENKGKVAFIVPHLAVLEFQISPVCGKLMVSYGLAGLLAYRHTLRGNWTVCRRMSWRR
jgi:hypothetical protein